MYVVVDEGFEVRTTEMADTSRLAVLVSHPRTALQRTRAALEGKAGKVVGTYALVSQAWLKAECRRSAPNGSARFAQLMEHMHQAGIDEEDGSVRVPVIWRDDAHFNRDCANRQASDVGMCHIYIVDTGESIRCAKGQTVLQAALAAGTTAIQSGCHGGGCGVCKVRVLSGTFACGVMSRAHVDAETSARRDVLACRVFPQSNLVVEVLGKSRAQPAPLA
jgi:ferredoxin